jgi:hypothetical protein
VVAPRRTGLGRHTHPSTADTGWGKASGRMVGWPRNRNIGRIPNRLEAKPRPIALQGLIQAAQPIASLANLRVVAAFLFHALIDYFCRRRLWRMSGQNSLMMLLRAADSSPVPPFSPVLCKPRSCGGNRDLDRPASIPLPKTSEKLKVVPPESVVATNTCQ